jgi:hypothetical protein
MCDHQRLFRTTFLHISLPLSSKRQLNCWATLLALQISWCTGWALVWISYQTVRGALLCSCWLFAPCFSAIDSLQECCQLFEELKGRTAFAGLAVGRRLCTHPYFISCLYFSDLVAVLAGHLCEFHTKQWGEPCSVPVSCLPHAFLQLIVCKSAVDCLKSLRAALLSQDWQWEGTFACTHTLFSLVLLRFGCCIGWALVWISYQTVSGALLWSCQLFALHFSAIDSLQECRLSSVWRAEGLHCFHRIGSGKVPSHTPYFLLTLLLFLYHTQQHDHEGLLFYVEEFSNATVSCRFAH